MGRDKCVLVASFAGDALTNSDGYFLQKVIFRKHKMRTIDSGSDFAAGRGATHEFIPL